MQEFVVLGGFLQTAQTWANAGVCSLRWFTPKLRVMQEFVVLLVHMR